MQSVWDEVKAKLNLVEVIEDYVDVKQLGGTYKCVCPFHPDKNPSLIISPEKGFWHCFGCGAGGDCFKFVMDFENISKKETLEKLAKKSGVDLEKVKFEPKKVADPKLLNLMEAGYKYLELSAKVYHQILLKILEDRNHPVTQYCLKRKLNSEAIKTFQIGYAPNSDLILQTAKKNGLNLNLLEKIGVLKLKDGVFLDKFKDRLMFPIANLEGKIVGFTGRNLPYDTTDRPRYLNSPQTEWFNKSQILYGYALNQKQIRSSKQIVFVEGNMDVVSSYVHGITNVVASQGTAFTSFQLQKVGYLTKNIALAFDNDSAGVTSGRKLFLEASKQKFQVEKVLIPENYKDLDEYLSAEHTDLTKPFELKTQYYLDFALTGLQPKLQTSDFLVQKQAIGEFLELLVFGSSLTKEHYLGKLAKLTQLSISTLQKELNQITSKAPQTEELEENQEPKTYKYQNITLNEARTSFENFLAKSLEKVGFESQNLETKTRTLLTNIFSLLQKIILDYSEFESLDTYLANNLDQIKFTASGSPIIEESNSLAKIRRALDDNLDVFKNEDNLLTIYLGFIGS